jgi:TolA-binding protein
MVLRIEKTFPVVVLVYLSMSGCFFFTTKREGRQLRRELNRLRERLNKTRENEQQLKAALTKARSELAKLEKVLDRARKVLLRNSADLGAKVQIIESRIGKILGRLENLEKDLRTSAGNKVELIRMIGALRMELAGLKVRVKQLHTRPAEPQGANAIFAHAQRMFHKGSYQLARKYFKRFADTFPNDSRAQYGLYLVGLSYFKENKYGAADYSFKKLLKRFPSGKYAPGAMLHRARCHYELKYCKSALNLLSALRKRFPKSTEATEAYRMFVRVRRVLRNSRFCGS